MSARVVSVAERRARLVRLHRLAGGAAGPEGVVRDVVALHGTDPASVYLSVLARCGAATLDDVADAVYARRSLVRWMAMRRTLFVLVAGDVPMVHAAASADVGAMLRRQLVSRLTRQGTTPAIAGPVDRWLVAVGEEGVRALEARGAATGAELSSDVPALRTVIAAGAPSTRPQNLTTPLLTLLGAEGRIVRGAPVGGWMTRQHRWEPAGAWWPGGIPVVDPGEARRRLAERWLARFGPATVEDLRWWTGWGVASTRAALAGLDLEEVDLHGTPGIALAGWEDATAGAVGDAGGGDPYGGEPVAALLPALDPTPMGWKRRDWFLGVPADQLFDRSGNIGPTVWWDGEVVGAWAVGADGEVRTAVVADRGAEAVAAVDAAAARLGARLGGAVVTPAFRTELERWLSA